MVEELGGASCTLTTNDYVLRARAGVRARVRLRRTYHGALMLVRRGNAGGGAAAHDGRTGVITEPAKSCSSRCASITSSLGCYRLRHSPA
jgi:hypothetical protein